MKIALCISGQMRNYRDNFYRFNRTIIEPTSPDIFIDTWSNAGSSTVNRDQDLEKYANSLITQEVLDQYYNPVSARIEEFNTAYLDNLDGKRIAPELKQYVPRSRGTLPMYYKIYQCDNLRQEYEHKHGFKYDLVIRARADLFLNNVLNLDLINERQVVYRLNPSEYAVYPSFVWDVFFAGNSEVMTHVCGVWNSLESYWEEARSIWSRRKFEEGNFDYWKVWKGSYLLSIHINRLGLGVETMNCGYQLEDKYRNDRLSNTPLSKVASRFKRLLKFR